MTSAEIRSARLALGLTQKEFGDLLHASLKAVQAWEYGQRNMTASTEELLKIKIKEKKMKFQVYANACDFGVIEAASEQETRDKVAQMAGYESEADMEDRLEAKSEITAKKVG